MFDYVVFSDGEGIDSGFDEEAGDNGNSVGLDDDNKDEENNDYGAGVDGDHGDGLGLDGDYGDGDYGDGLGLDGDNEDGVGVDGDNEDGVGLDGDNEDGVGLDGDYGDITKECQTFANKEVMRDIFREYAVQEGVVLNRIKNDKQRQTYQCNAAGCPWRAHASWMIDKTTFILKTLVDQHECHRVCNNKEAKVKWIASKFDSIVKSNPSLNVKVLADLLLEKFNVSVDLKRLYGVKHRVLRQIRSEHEHSFKYLRQYAYTLNQTNPGQKGLIKALSKHFPTASKRYCARHIYANFRGSYCGDSFKKLFWKASRSSNVFDFKAALNDIGEIQPGAKEWLSKIEPRLWLRFAFDAVSRCDHVTNNMTEAFNSLLGTHRSKTYLQLLEFIRRMLMRKFQERKDECDAWRTVLPPRVHAKILKHSKASRQMTIISAGDQEYEILGQDGTFAVKLKQYNCGCGSWQISGIPCPHAMAAISHNCGKESFRDMVPRYVHQSLTKSAYMQTYKGMIHPVPDQKMWPEIVVDEVLPPPIHVQPDRQKMQRKRESGEKCKGGRIGTVVCTYCKKAGHNTRTCKEKKEARKVHQLNHEGRNQCQYPQFKVKFTVNIHHQQLKLQVHSQQERRKPRNNIKHQKEVPKIHPNLNHSHSSLIEEYGLKYDFCSSYLVFLFEVGRTAPFPTTSPASATFHLALPFPVEP
ncbi:hypothetical protein Q3G72_026413 [Acer saccharum]|nr:hypothetical protein Q3G72_026413 [Acer saccharum]